MKEPTVTLCQLAPDTAELDKLEKINRDAFPSEEQLSVPEMFRYAARTDSAMLGIYADAELVGFLLFTRGQGVGYVFYLAVARTERSRGYGAAALRALAALYPDLQLTLDFEPPDPTAENQSQRLRRKAFYLRCGFCETGCYTRLNRLQFELVCKPAPLNVPAFCALLQTMHAALPDKMSATLERRPPSQP